MKKILNFFVTITILLNISSCKHNNTIEEHKAKLRTINASFNAGDINLAVDYEQVYESNIIYQNYTLFREFIEGQHTIQIKNANGSVLIDTVLRIEPNKQYSLFLYDSANTLKYKVVDENLMLLTGSQCKLRFLNLSNNSPSIDLFKDNDSIPMFQNFENGMYSEYTSMSDLTHQFFIINSISKDTLCRKFPSNFKAGAYYTLFVSGNMNAVGNDSLSFYAIESTTNY